MATKDEVLLVVPAMPEFLRLARVTAAGLASRLGFSYDEVEDLRLAIDELCYGLTGEDGRPGTVEIRYRLDGDSLSIEGTLQDSSPAPSDTALAELSELILGALVDEHNFKSGPDGPRFRLLKRREPSASAGGHPSQP
ncbi:MAG: ATP-binding protein [Actinomycetota bacterium]|nr:ATP-binding protein [Actinomycetota bacterium]